MVTKRELLDDPNSCLNKCADDEPVFLLRGQDMFAAPTVRMWAAQVGAERFHRQPAKPTTKEDEAYAIAHLMDKWPTKKVPD